MTEFLKSVKEVIYFENVNFAKDSLKIDNNVHRDFDRDFGSGIFQELFNLACVYTK